MCNNICTAEMNTVIQKHKCTMCGACYNVCPVGAISYKEDLDGFEYPCIDETKCTKCGLCTKKCPALNTNQTQEIVKKLKKAISYGGYINNEEIREKSSSGGVFTILSEYVLDRGGYVCGAKFIQGGTLEHVIIDKKEELSPLRGSKYVQSNIGYTYKQIKELLNKGSYVLFTGTPCQVAGLYSVLGKDYDKLITVDLLCTGTPSQRVFKEYLSEITNNNLEKVENIKFRVKVNGWRNYHFEYECDNKKYSMPVNECEYYNAFVKHLILRKSCSDCRYNRLPRQGDFTIGDYWGVEKYYKQIDDNKGTSAIIVNTKKAEKILKETKKCYSKLIKTKLKTIKKYNMLEGKSYPHPHRNYFMKNFSEKNYKKITELIKESLNKRDGIACLNYHYARENYGSVFVGYALQERLRQMGYTPCNIIMADVEGANDISNLGDFVKEYIDETPICSTQDRLRDLNNYYSTFIVGSDGVWRDAGFMKNFYNQLLDFADFSKNLCSYSASFGGKDVLNFRKKSKEPVTPSLIDINTRKYLMKRFNHISVREKHGVDICRNVFGVEAEHILDAVFLLTKEEWQKITSKSKLKKDNKYIAKYIHDYQDVPADVQESLSSLENVVSLYEGSDFRECYTKGKGFKTEGPKIEDWLYLIENCELLITNSFHGCCFAIIFNKPFIAFAPEYLGRERIDSLLETFNLQDRLATNNQEFNELLNKEIDFEKVNQIMSQRVSEARDYLQKIVNDNGKYDQSRSYMESLEIQSKLMNFDIKPNEILRISLFGIQIIKMKYHKFEPWIYLFGIRMIKKEIVSPNEVYYKLFGKIEIFKKKVS